MKKKYYSVVIESTVPATLKFKVEAESPQQAEELVRTHKLKPSEIKYHLNRKKDIKATVNLLYQSMILFIKKYF